VTDSFPHYPSTSSCARSVPKPALTFAVGVTGHRSDLLVNKDSKHIERQISAVFKNIENECRAEQIRQRGRYAELPPHISLITSLADGADAISIRLRPAKWKSIGILPFPEENIIEALRTSTPAENVARAMAEYAQARQDTAQIIVLPQLHHDDKSGFARAHNIMLRQIDLLVAVWNGIGKDNSDDIADVITQALKDGIPVVWISTEKPQAPWLISSIEDPDREEPEADATSGPISEAVQRQLGISEHPAATRDPWHFEDIGAGAQTRLLDFLNEEVPRRFSWPWVAYDWMRTGPKFWLWRITKTLSGIDQIRENWSLFVSALPDGSELNKSINDVLLPRFAAADALATYYGHKYRSAYVLAYTLSIIAVAAALSHFAIGLAPQAIDILATSFGSTPHRIVAIVQVVIAFLEFLSVISIIVIVWMGQTKRWHDRWLDYRALAETLRHLRFLALLGQYEKRSDAEASARTGASWILWYLRATMRELGLPSGDLGAEYQRKILGAVVRAELAPQIEYHSLNMRVLRRLHSRLHLWSNAFFFLAAAILLVLVVMQVVALVVTGVTESEWFTKVIQTMMIVTAFLPALGAALAGIRFTGDFDGFARRSAETGAELDVLQARYAVALDRLDFDITTSVVYEAARIMAADINGWTSLYSRKSLVLPG
jgi:hypothetical protein